ncbi:interferon alpha-2-like [Ovis canadensis]
MKSGGSQGMLRGARTMQEPLITPSTQNLPRPPLQAVLQAPSIAVALLISVLLALGMLCSSPTCSLGCELPASRSNLESFTRSNQMERVPTVSCLRDRTDFRFPQTLAHGTRLEKTEATAVVHELLQQTFQLFSTTGSSVGRNESLLDRLLVGLDQQLEDLDACLREGRTLEQSPLGSENSRLAVKSYFQRISVYFKEKEYSRCAWEVVSVEIRRCLVFANKLIRKLRI